MPSFKKSLIVEQFQGNYLKEAANLGKNKSRSNDVNSHHAISHLKHSSKERKRVSDKEISPLFSLFYSTTEFVAPSMHSAATSLVGLKRELLFLR